MTKKKLTGHEAYIKRRGSGCPFCGPKADVEGEGVDIGDGGASQEITCKECGGVWDDLYTLTGISVISVPDKEKDNG